MTKCQTMHFLHHVSANSHTCRYDAIIFVGSMDGLVITLTECENLGLLRVSLPKIVGVDKFSVPICKIFQFWPFLSFDKISSFKVLFSFLLVWWLLLHFVSGANIAGPFFILRNTIIEDWRQFHYRSVEFAMCHLDSRWLYDAIVAFENFDDMSHLVFTSFHWIIYHPHKFPFFQISYMFFWPLWSLIPLWKIFTCSCSPDYFGICLSRFEGFSQVIVLFIGWHKRCTCTFSS